MALLSLEKLVRVARGIALAGILSCTFNAGGLPLRYDGGADDARGDTKKDPDARFDGSQDAYFADARLDMYTLKDAGADAVHDGSITKDYGNDLSSDGGRDAQIDVYSANDAGIDMAADAYVPDAGMIDAPADGLFADARPDAYTLDSAVVDLYSAPDAAPMPDLGSDSFSPCFPVSCIFPDGPSDGSLYADVVPDAGPADAYIPADASITPDIFDPCPADAPLNSSQAGVCAGSYQSCTPEGWQDNYSSLAGYETVEISCDGADNDCDSIVDDGLAPPSQGCTTGVGECERSGLEYATCLGASGWSSTYSGCDAISGEPTPELCDDLDRNCNSISGREDLTEIVDNFDRADQAGLGDSALGNPWDNLGTADDWDIEGNAAVTSWIGGPTTNPTVSSIVGHRDTFHSYLVFTLSEVNNVGGAGALIYSINSSQGLVDGLSVHLCMDSAFNHALYREGVEVGTGIQFLSADTRYRLKMNYDGSTLGVKIWEESAVEPADYLMSATVANVDISKPYLTLTGDADGGEMLTTTVDYVRNECE